MKKGVVLIGQMLLSILTFKQGHALTYPLGNGGNGALVGRALPFGNDQQGYRLEILGFVFILLATGLLYRERLAKFARKIRPKQIDAEWQGAYCPIGRKDVVCSASVCSFG